MSRKLTLITFILPLLFSLTMLANDNRDLCCSDSGQIFYGDWLYWRVRNCNLDYAVPAAPGNEYIGKVSVVEPSYKSGFRVGFMYECSRLFFDGFYSRFNHEYTNRTIRADGLQGATRSINTSNFVPNRDMVYAEGSYSITYDTVDLIVGTRLNSCLCLHPYLFGGLKLAFIDQNFTAFYAETDIPFANGVSQSSQDITMDGYGVDLGFGGQYDIWRCLNFFGRLSVDLLLSDFEKTYKFNTGQQNSLDVEVKNLCLDTWKLVSALNLTFGLNYNYQFSKCFCHDLAISIGYEFHQYLGMADFLDYSDDTTHGANVQRDQANIGLDGLFIRISLCF